MTDPQPPFRQTAQSYVVYIIAALFLGLIMALQVSTSVMTHGLMIDLGVGAPGIGLISGAFFLTYTVMQIPGGFMIDRLDTRWCITVAVGICVLGSFVFAISGTVAEAMAGRALMGAGASFAFVGAIVMASRWFPVIYFGLFVGLSQLVAASGSAGGQVPVAILMDDFGWRGAMYIITGIGIVITILAIIFIRNNPKNRPAPKVPDNETGIFKSLKTLSHNKQTWYVGLYAFAGWGPITAFASLWGVPFFMQLYGISNTKAAMAVLMIWLGQAAASPVVGWFSDRVGRRCTIMSWLGALGLITSIVVIYVPEIPVWALYILLFIFGIATAGQLLTFALARDNNRRDLVGTAIGFNNMALVASGMVLQFLIGYILHLNWHGEMIDGRHFYGVNDYRIALIVVPLCFLASWIISSLLIRETFCMTVEERTTSKPVESAASEAALTDQLVHS